MELGSVADWVGAIGGLLAVGAAVVAWLSSRQMLALEKQREDRGLRESEREQAELVLAIAAFLPDREGAERWAIYVYNGSTKPVFDVSIESQQLDGVTANRPVKIGVLPPGRFVVPINPKYRWGSLLNVDESPEQIELLVKGEGTKLITKLEFTDVHRNKWEVIEGLLLRCQPEKDQPQNDQR